MLQTLETDYPKQTQSEYYSLKRELLSLEKKYWQALKDRDVLAALELTDSTCLVTGPQGMKELNREEMAQMMEQSTEQVRDFEFGDQVVVKLIADDVAVLAYKVKLKLTVEEKPLSLDATETSVWVRRGDKWLCSIHNETLAGDPYGRDRERDVTYLDGMI